MVIIRLQNEGVRDAVKDKTDRNDWMRQKWKKKYVVCNICMDWLKNFPYILLIIANLTYLYLYGFKPLQYHPKLILYNFLIFLLIGVILFFKVSYHLYQWFVKGQGDTKQKMKEKIAELLRMVEMVGNYFRPGNLHNLVYLYAILALWTFLSYLVPSILLGFFFGLLHETMNKVKEKYPDKVKQYKQLFFALVQSVENFLPRYKQSSVTIKLII